MSTPAKALHDWLAERIDQSSEPKIAVLANAVVRGWETGMANLATKPGTGSDMRPKDTIDLSLQDLEPVYETGGIDRWQAVLTADIASDLRTARMPGLIKAVDDWAAANAEGDGWWQLRRNAGAAVAVSDESTDTITCALTYEVMIDGSAHPFDGAYLT